MAIRIDTLQNAGVANADHPFGQILDSTSQTTNNGTRVEAIWGQCIQTFFDKLILNQGLTPDGSIETVNKSQYFDALIHLIQNSGSGENRIGAIEITTNPNPPSDDWVVADGSEINRTTYSNYFGVVGVTWGDGDGVNTFNIPNLAGRFLAIFDALASSDIGNTVGEYKEDQFQGHWHLVSEGSSNGGSLNDRSFTDSNGKNPNQMPLGGSEAGTNYGACDIISDKVNGEPRFGSSTHPRYTTVYGYVKIS